MRPNQIRVNGVYGGLSSVECRELPERTVWAVFHGTVLYAIQDPKSRHTWDRIYRNCSVKAFARWAQWEAKVQENDHLAFLDNCRKLVARFGVPYGEATQEGRLRLSTSWNIPASCGLVYDDDRITVVCDTRTGRMNIDRKPVDDPERPHLRAHNPAVFIDENGKSFRFHGEWIVLKDHVEALLAA